ncbi:MAG: helix-turn-helix transcriptional regulator [Acidobacteria bacterium]|nr:helix-turn-helix transcriptional regulator [Acidobacteriota bacterium]MCA1620622.1 helix-turn-helix transcriptional regulator [Acidobacteriota bacterium]
MPRTLLAVGPWRECGKLVASAMANRWSVLYTLLFEDIPEALGVTRVDLILLSGCSTRLGWERVARGAWEICGDTPVVALGAGPGQDALVSALVGGSLPGGGVAAGERAPEEPGGEFNVFRERLGVCFVSYLGRVRLRRAAELLARTEMPVTRVALEVGFNDLSHFERVFRTAYRRSPSKYRGESKKMSHGEKYTPSFSAPAVTS